MGVPSMTEEKNMEFRPVLDDGVPSDVTIGSNDGGELHVHKVVLNGNSKFFRAIEYDSDDHSFKLDRTFAELEAFFSFLYTEDRLSFLNWENVCLALGPLFNMMLLGLLLFAPNSSLLKFLKTLAAFIR